MLASKANSGPRKSQCVWFEANYGLYPLKLALSRRNIVVLYVDVCDGMGLAMSGFHTRFFWHVYYHNHCALAVVSGPSSGGDGKGICVVVGAIGRNPIDVLQMFDDASDL
ncbi:hypothetical protein QVD17_12554 [Tagetes erecta]|uniref:Uncharacterized protein n=1 Tax=Tagetes erecta TaxID=13708 RepID=A0AAD8L161_TARER|nr:hypothetical protein QVD17_12554 [Tagetes erecta]